MSKSKEELNELKKEVEAVNEKLAELTPEEIAQVNGGMITGAAHFRIPVIKEAVCIGYIAHEMRRETGE